MISTVNPVNGKVIANYEELSEAQIAQKIEIANKRFSTWKNTSFKDRSDLFLNLVEILKSHQEEFARLITLEMGKPITQSIDEIEKCCVTAKHYAQNIEKILQNEIYHTKHSQSFVSFEPIGVILAIMPWNFPFWQALRAAIPTILAGNVMILKHASSVQGSAAAIEKLFLEAGFPEGVFTNLCISSSKVESIIRNPFVKAVTLTGSEAVGKQVASIAGSEIKKTVMELGGSDPFIVFADADIDFACENAAKSRLRNAGQACTAAKRFIVAKEVEEQFAQRLAQEFASIKVGDPMLPEIEMGPLSSEKALLEIEKQVQESIQLGANIVIGGKRYEHEGAFFQPTILSNVKRGMPAYDEEIFGPVASIISFEDIDEAIQIANDTRFGLAASIWTKDMVLANRLTPQIESGSVFVNTLVSSEPTMPFGGTKMSGYGRELSEYGVKEFLNIKTVIIK